jgi:hypothetical protein
MDTSLAVDRGSIVVILIALNHFERRMNLTQVEMVAVERVYYRAKYINSPHVVRVCVARARG